MPVSLTRVAFVGLLPALAQELNLALALIGVEVVAAGDAEVQLAFCNAANVSDLVLQSPEIPVVAVSSEREVGVWLDAMDAGAVDYCSAPFESTDLRWILHSNCRPSVQMRPPVRQAA